MDSQWWLAEMDQYGSAKLCDGPHLKRDGAEKAATLIRRLGLHRGRKFAVAEVRLTDLTGTHSPVDETAIDTLNAIGLRPNTRDHAPGTGPLG